MMGSGVELWLGRLAILTLYGVWPPGAQPVRYISHISPRPVLIMHGTTDRQIPVEDAYRLKNAGGAHTELWIAPGADHLIYTEDGNGSGKIDTEYRTHILDFLARVQPVNR